MKQEKIIAWQPSRVVADSRGGELAVQSALPY
jgi:hypothetical protein